MSTNNNTLDGVGERANKFCFLSDVSVQPLEHHSVHKLMADFAQAETATLTTQLNEMREALRTIRDHYRLRNLECKYCGDAAAIAARGLDKSGDD